MKIVIACGAMPFGPRTPTVGSIGGSEMAALQLAKALGARGHDVHLFCNLPAPNAPDACAPAGYVEAGVTYGDLRSQFGEYVNNVEHDLMIAVRDPQLVAFECMAKKKVLWAHDIFTKRGMGKALSEMGWVFDEIWTVSEWHRHQINEATGYPLDHIVALRNGIVRYDDVETLDRSAKHIIYASRPERGLDNLIMPGGIMDCLPEYTLTVAMYPHFPEHMRPYYEQIFARMREMKNVEFVGGKTNHDLRQMIADSAAYIYPTQFEETSCILARECIEHGTPFVTTSVGALPETLGDCGLYFEDWLFKQGLIEPDRGTPGWCKMFAQFFRETMQDQQTISATMDLMALRDDLYWDGVAEIVEENSLNLTARKQTIGAAIIAMNNEDCILRCLNSLDGQVDAINVALGPTTDGTRRIIEKFGQDHPAITVRIIDVPKIEPWKFGFDNARNVSAESLLTDWVLWIDTDEYLVGDIRKYARENEYNAYMISQHHFTVEPRGNPPQIDRPARLFRNGKGYRAVGHIHEHFEVPEGGPGNAFLLPDVDIGHTGYVNEAVRKQRFDRNWPFLEWQHAEPKLRKIDHFLWFRDIVHRMRAKWMAGEREAAVKLAQEAETYYNEHQLDMSAFGPGIFMALGYLAEAYKLLGKQTLPVKIALQLDDTRGTKFEGSFENYEQFEKVMSQVMKPEFDDRKSRYF